MSHDPSNTDPMISDAELRERVLYALFFPVVQTALRYSMPLQKLKKRIEMAYFHETRRRGFSMKETMQTMSISISKATGLSRQLKQNFAGLAAQAHGLPRRIEYILWAEPLSRARLGQAMREVEADALNEALLLLVAEQRIALIERGPRQDPVYQLTVRKARRVWSSWLARLDGLDNALDSVTRAIVARFFDNDPHALARTVTFHIRREDLPALRRLYEERVFPALAELDAAASSDSHTEDTDLVSFSIFWSRCPQTDEESDT